MSHIDLGSRNANDMGDFISSMELEEDPLTLGRGEYARVETFRAGKSIPLVLDGQEAARVPFEEVLR